MGFLFYTSMILFVIVCVFLILLILIQKGRGGGLASAFGGAGGNTAFGSKTGDVLTWATSIVFGVFIVLAVVLNLVANYEHDRTKPANVAKGAAPVSIPMPASSDGGPEAPAPAPTPTPAPETSAPAPIPAPDAP